MPLLDNTSVGLAHRHGEFLDLKDRISNSLRLAVNEHFQAFNDSVGSYRSVVQNIANSQQILSKVKDTINTSTKDLSESKDNMNTLNENLKTYNDMVEILTIIEYLKKVPNDLEDAISDKNYSKAQYLLQSVTSKAQEYRLWELPALSNLESYFETQSQQLFEILIEETHNIIYSKKLFNSFNNSNDFFNKSDTSDYSNIEKHLMNAIDVDIFETAATSYSNVEHFLMSLINTSAKLNTDGDPTQDTTLENENEVANMVALDDTNPFNQLLHLLTIIYKLDKLPTAIEIIVQRYANEINQLVNRVTEDTRLRHAKIIKYLNTSTSKSKDLTRGLGIDESLNDDTFKTVVVRDLFWNFFRRLLFLLQSVRVILDIVNYLENHRFDSVHVGTSNSSITGDGSLTLLKLWNSLKNEVRNLVSSYISDNDSSLGSKLTNISSIKTDPSKPHNSLFQFYKVNYDNDHSNQLKLVLQDLFPGFINSNDMSKIDSPYIEDTKFLKQTRIIPANIFHMRIILEPFLVFIQGSKLLMEKKDSEEPIIFFNGFMTNEFLPLLEESFISFYIDEVEEIDPYEVYDEISEKSLLAPSHNLNEVKIFKFVVEFKRYFSDVCFILNTSLQFRKEFSSIIFKLLNRFLDKVEDTSKELISELCNYLEPNREVIKALRDPTAKLSEQALSHINKSDLKKVKVIDSIKILDNSLKFLIRWFEDYLIKKVDLNKTDLNLSTIEKLRKNWSFFEITNFKTNNLHDNELDLNNSVKVILNEQLTENYEEIVGDYKTIEVHVQNVLKRFNQILTS